MNPFKTTIDGKKVIANDIKETWKDVIGYEGLYMVSNIGNVKSLPGVTVGTRNRPSIKRGKILKRFPNRLGYICVKLFINKTTKNVKIHRLVAQAFIPNIENKPQVNHIDGIKANNTPENLEWCTASENGKHAYRTGLNYPKNGANNGNSFLTEEQVKEIRNTYKNGITYTSLAEEYGVSRKTITNIIKNITWKV